MLQKLLIQGPGFGCTTAGTSNPFCPEDIANFGIPLLAILLLAATGLALYKAWQVSRKNESEKKRVLRILTTIAILAGAYIVIAFVPFIYSGPNSLLVIAVLGTAAIISFYRAQKSKKQQPSFDKSPIHSHGSN